MESLPPAVIVRFFLFLPSVTEVLEFTCACRSIANSFKEAAEERTSDRMLHDFPFAATAVIPSPILEKADGKESSYARWRYWGMACTKSILRINDDDSYDGIANGTSARLSAVLRGTFMFRSRDSGDPLTAEEGFAHTVAAIKSTGVKGDQLPRMHNVSYAGSAKRYEVVWWGPDPNSKSGKGFVIRRDSAIKLYTPIDLDIHVQMFRDSSGRDGEHDGYSDDDSFGYASSDDDDEEIKFDIAPSSGHHCLVEPRQTPTYNNKPGFDANTFWSAAFWMVHLGTCGVSEWDHEYGQLARIVSSLLPAHSAHLQCLLPTHGQDERWQELAGCQARASADVHPLQERVVLQP